MGEIVKRHDKAFGASGTDVVGKIHNSDDHIDILKGSEAATFYDKMRRSDAQVRKVLSAVAYPVKAATWSVEPASDEEADLKVAAIVDQVLFKDISFSKFINEALTLLMHGFSMFEVVHMNKDNKELGPYTGLAQLGFRKQNTITEWNHDKITGKLVSVKQEATGDIEISVEIPAEFLLLFFNEQEGDNIGFPLGRILYGPYKRKLLATELQYIGAEKFAIPTPILTTPKKVAKVDEEYLAAIDVLKGFTSAEDSYIVKPEGWELELHDNKFDPDKLGALRKLENEEMTGAILASFLELGTGGNGGAYSLGNDLSDFFLNGLESIANTIRDTINLQLIPQIVSMNFGEDVSLMPQLAYSGISDKAGKEIMEIITGYVSGGVITKDEMLEDHVRKIHKLPKKAEGTAIDNQETGGDKPPGEDAPPAEPPKEEVTLKLAENFGHTHKGTGPAIQRGQKHYHQLLNSDDRTKAELDTPTHTHVVDGENVTSKPVKSKALAEPKDNPKALILSLEPEVTSIIRRNLKNISDKYINDIMKKYATLSDKQKLNATKNIKVGGVNAFKKELKAALTGAAKKSLKQVRAEVPEKANVKLGYDMDAIRLQFDNADTFKFTDFSDLPRHMQILVGNQAGIIADKEAGDIADTVAFQFNSSESSTRDIEVLRNDLQTAADTKINGAGKDTVGTTVTSTIVNEARNEFLLSPEVVGAVSSFTFFNADPKSSICKTLAGTSYGVSDVDLVRHQPPLHQNCKSYLRANLKSSSNLPNVTGLPELSETDLKSITLKDD